MKICLELRLRVMQSEKVGYCNQRNDSTTNINCLTI